MNLENGHPPERSGLLAAAMPLALLTFATLLAFANAWPASLVLDDKAFAGPGRAPELDSLQYMFTQSVWDWISSGLGLYRPLLLLQLFLETRVFGGWLEGYHLSNIFQHLLVTLLLYGFLQFLLRSTGGQPSASRFCALLAALVFAVHPIHTEVVNSVFNRSDIMVAMFALAGFWWLLYFLDRHALRAWAGLAITYFLAMLCKESAIVIPGLAVILILMVKPGHLTSRLRQCLPVLWLLLPLALYLFMRANALVPPDPETLAQATAGSTMPTMLHSIRLPGFENLLDAFAALGTAFRLVAWPYPLQLMHGDSSTTESLLYTGLNLGLIIAALVQVKRRRYVFAAGLAFFYLAMLPASRIISMGGNANPHFAERYAYVPSIGLTILLAFALRALSQRLSPRALARIALPVLLVLTAVTWARNTDWRSEASLFGADYKRGLRAEATLRWMTSAHLKAGNFAWVVKICDDNLAKQEEYGGSAYVQSCASAYERQHRYEEAERAHLYAIDKRNTRVAASMSLAHFYLRRARPLDAEQRFKAAIDWSGDPADKALNTAEMIIALNPNNREQAIAARGYIEDALQHRPGWPKAETMLKAIAKGLNTSPILQIPGESRRQGQEPDLIPGLIH
ncbi:MAG: hypothetical protein EXR85_04335 [Xanthomonadales bacterium]|nr:hypothetical protein [Xanthomonadales bacterium]